MYKKVLIVIPTHKRPQWCLDILRQIDKQKTEHEYTITVFHDKCDSDYSELKEYAKDKGHGYFITKRPFGKWDFWLLNNLMYKYAETKQYDYFIQLPDDIVLVKDFINRAVNLMIDGVECVNFFTPKCRLKAFATYPIIDLNGVDAWDNNRADCCFIATKQSMDDLQMQMPQNAIIKDVLKGSGAGHQFSKAYFEKNNIKIKQTIKSLCEHIGNNDSAMHGNDRKKKIYHKYKFDPILLNLSKSDKSYINNIIRNKAQIKTSDFAEYVKGKSVAIVGNAPNIKGLGLGAEIDSFDIVLRSNFYPVPEYLINDYGSKCDILSLLKRFATKDKLKQYKANGVEFIIHYAPIINKVDGLGYFEMTKERRQFVDKEINEITKGDVITATSGITNLYYILINNCREVKLFGFTGYQNKNKEVAEHDEVWHRCYNKDDDDFRPHPMKKNKYHNYQVQNDYLRYLIKIGKLQLDNDSKYYFT